MTDVNQLVCLNIGGYKYQTTHDTLVKHSTYFTNLLQQQGMEEDGQKLLRDKEGNIFIDREGQYFQPLLEWMRTGEVFIRSELSVRSVWREAKYFGVDAFIRSLNEHEDYFFEYREVTKNSGMPKYIQIDFSASSGAWYTTPDIGIDITDSTSEKDMIHVINRVSRLGYELCESTLTLHGDATNRNRALLKRVGFD